MDLLRKTFALVALPVAAALAVPAMAQIQTVDPDTMIDADLLDPSVTAAPPQEMDPAYDDGYAVAEPSDRYDAHPELSLPQDGSIDGSNNADVLDPTVVEAAPSQNQDTYAEDDLIGAAEGLFGRGAEGLARLIQDILADQGEPNGYIVGREGGGAFVLGVRYGSGTLYHAVEGNMPVYWTGPSIGIDAGANAANTFVLVYNLHDTEDLYERFPAGEGQAYFVGGFNASYVRRGDIVLIPIRVGAGLRLGVNAGYLRFSHRQRWLPF